jgi:hypothetical protein
MFLDVVRLSGFCGFHFGKSLWSAIRRIDRGYIYVKTQLAQLDDLTQDENHRQQRVLADQVRDGTRFRN